jgi:hypothetical protein
MRHPSITRAYETLERTKYIGRKIIRRDFNPWGERERFERSIKLDEINRALDEIERDLARAVLERMTKSRWNDWRERHD